MSKTTASQELDKNNHPELEEMDLEYPPVVRAIMWGHSLLKNRLIEDFEAIQALDLP